MSLTWSALPDQPEQWLDEEKAALDTAGDFAEHNYRSSASKASPLDASPLPTDARFPAHTNNRPSYQRAAW
jgi:hypothetical protein